MKQYRKKDTDAVIVSARRSPIGRAGKVFGQVRPDDLAASVIRELWGEVATHGLPDFMIDDLIVGCAIPEAEQGMNVARITGFRTGLPDSVAAVTVNRFCASGLETIANATAKISAGHAEVVIAGGTESMSMVPMPGVHPAAKFSPNPHLMQARPEVYSPMLVTAENVRRKYGISREEQDLFSLRSHQNAVAAIKAGKFKDEIVPITVRIEGWEGVQETIVDTDEGPRQDSTLEKLAKLEPALTKLGIEYSHGGLTITAGNSSQMSDGAAFVFVMKRDLAKRYGLQPMARLVSYATAGVPPEIMGIGPVVAIPKALAKAGLTRKDVPLIELNEAFAVQCIAVINELNLGYEGVNIHGGAIALGHPLGCSGARLTVSLLHEMRRTGTQFGLVSMCVGGGQGAAGVFELE